MSGFAPPLGSPTVHQLVQTGYDVRGRIECIAVRMNPAELATPPASACDLDDEGGFGPDRITRNVYDSANQLTKVQTGYGVTGVQADELTATYTANGRAETVTDAEGNRTTYEYDVHDRLAKTRFPSPTTDGVSSTTDYEQPTYDLAGNVTSLRLRDGQSIAFGYDALGRLTSKDLPGTEPTIAYSYDLLGRLTQASSDAGISAWFAYDALGRVTAEGGYVGSHAMQYDLAGRRTRLAWSDGFYVDYDYLVTGEVSHIRENGATSGVGVLATFGYDDLGRRTSLTRGNGTATSYGHDGVSRLDQLVQDMAGTGDDLTLAFSHNPASQIAETQRSNDAYSFTGLANLNRTDTHDGLNRILQTGGINVTHDARGNVTNDGARTYSYDSQNRLIHSGGPNNLWLTYDPLGRLLSIVPGGQPHDYMQHDGATIVSEHDGQANVRRRYVHGPGVDEPLVWYEGSGTTDRRWLHADERGSIVATSDSAGAVTAINRYDEYGVPHGPGGAGTLTGRFGYTGQAWLPRAGIYYYRARVYNPRLGRFMQTDPIGYGDGMNLYAYVRNDPVNLIDPSGMMSVDCPEEPGSGVTVCGKRWRPTTYFSWGYFYELGGWIVGGGGGADPFSRGGQCNGDPVCEARYRNSLEGVVTGLARGISDQADYVGNCFSGISGIDYQEVGRDAAREGRKGAATGIARGYIIGSRFGPAGTIQGAAGGGVWGALTGAGRGMVISVVQQACTAGNR